jgi:nucleoside-diphosphate-sugar epimerase
MKVLITGAAGRLGPVTTALLASRGYEVRAVDREARADLPAPVAAVDLLDPAAALAAVQGVEAVVHLANHSFFADRDHHRIHNDNVTMNFNVFLAAAQGGARKIVWASSIQVLGAHPDVSMPGARRAVPPAYLPADAQHPVQPANPYALSKALGEVQLRYIAEQYGLSGVALRFPWLLTARNVDQLRQQRPRDLEPAELAAYLKMGDAAALIEAVLRCDLPGYRCYFPAAPDPLTGESAAALIERLYSQAPLRRPREQMQSLVDTAQITQQTGWRPTTLDDPGY